MPSLFDAGCVMLPSATLLHCFDFDTSSPMGGLQRVSGSSPSTEMTAEVVFDGGRPGGVLRLTAPGSFSGQNNQQHGVFYRISVEPRRRLYVAFDVFPLVQENGAQLHYAAFESPGFGQLSFAGDEGGLHLYLSSMAGNLNATSQGTPIGQWTRLEWLVDFDVDVTTVRRANQVAMDAGFMASVSGGLDLRLGISGLYQFNTPLVVYLDNVVVRALP